MAKKREDCLSPVYLLNTENFKKYKELKYPGKEMPYEQYKEFVRSAFDFYVYLCLNPKLCPSELFPYISNHVPVTKEMIEIFYSGDSGFSLPKETIPVVVEEQKAETPANNTYKPDWQKQLEENQKLIDAAKRKNEENRSDIDLSDCLA